MSRPLTIFLIGEISSGKSSFLNALAGGIVSCVSLLRETINPEIYEFIDRSGKESEFDPNIGNHRESLERIAKILDEKHAKNKESVNGYNVTKPAKRTIEYVIDIDDEPIKFMSLNNRSFLVYDFPGLNDSTDSEDLFYDLIKKNINKCDILLYITKADSAFINKSGVDLFDKIRKLCSRTVEHGQFIELCVVINKFDDADDNDLTEIASLVPEKISFDEIFRFSSHTFLLSSILRHKLTIPVPYFLQNEMRKIFKNAGYKLNESQKQCLANDNKITYCHIKNNENRGDWDGLMDKIVAVGDDIHHLRRKIRRSYFELNCEKFISSNIHEKDSLKKMTHAITSSNDDMQELEYILSKNLLKCAEENNGYGAFRLYKYVSTLVCLKQFSITMLRVMVSMIKDTLNTNRKVIGHYHIAIIEHAVIYKIFNKGKWDDFLLDILRLPIAWKKSVVVNHKYLSLDLIDTLIDYLPEDNIVRQLLYLEMRIPFSDLETMLYLGELPMFTIENILGREAVIRLMMYSRGNKNMRHPLFNKGYTNETKYFDHRESISELSSYHDKIKKMDKYFLSDIVKIKTELANTTKEIEVLRNENAELRAIIKSIVSHSDEYMKNNF